MLILKRLLNTLLKLTLLILCFLSVFGCASVSKTMDSWVGHHESELIQSWGPPDQVVPDGKGGSILIYSSYVNLGQSPGVIKQVGYITTYTAPQARGYNRTRMFYVDKDGKIYSWRWKGL